MEYVTVSVEVLLIIFSVAAIFVTFDSFMMCHHKRDYVEPSQELHSVKHCHHCGNCKETDDSEIISMENLAELEDNFVDAIPEDLSSVLMIEHAIIEILDGSDNPVAINTCKRLLEKLRLAKLELTGPIRLGVM